MKPMSSGEFSHFRVLSRLGAGGMGEVFLAEDLTLHRKVALKFLIGDENGRLMREARAVAQLDHPFICKVYETGEHDGRLFFAMEFVDGATLKERLADGPLPRTEAIRIAGEIADALHFAHTRGIVHRDLKPANIMLGADGHAKVMDFGIAKRLAVPAAADADTLAVMTASVPGMTGTLAYMSPEQLRGLSVDPRSDVFAFGLVLHEMITGVHPFIRPSAIETANAILNDPVPAVDQAVTRGSQLLAHIMSRCLEKDPDRRYQSLSDVRIELEGLQAPSTPPAPVRRTRTWIAAAMMAVVVLGGIHMVRPLPFLSPEPALAFKEREWIVVADFNNLTNDPVFDSSLKLALQVALGQSQYVNVFPNDRVGDTLRRMQQDPAQRLAEPLAIEVAQRDGVRGVLACDIALLGSRYSITARLIDPQNKTPVLTDSVTADGKDAVLPALDRLAKRVRTSLGESLSLMSAQTRPLPLVTTSSLDALKLYADAMKLERDEDAATSLQLLQQAVTLDPEFALAHAELGRRYYLGTDSGRRELAEKHSQIALSLADRLTLRERLWIQASVEDSRGNRERAANAFKVYLAQYPDDTSALFRLAWTEMAGLQRYQDAIEHFKRLIAINGNNATAYVNLATAYSSLDDYPSAIANYEKSFELSPEMLLGVFVNHEYGFTLVRAGREDDAQAVFERMKKEAPVFNRARGHRSAAFLEMYRGRYAAAIAELRQAIVLNRTHRATVSEYRDRLNLYSALEAAGQRSAADTEWEGIDRIIATQSFSPEWLWRPARLMARRGRIAEAERLIGLMQKTASNTTAASATNRNLQRDAAYIEVAHAEVQLAKGRIEEALKRIEPAHVSLSSADSLETLAATFVAAGRTADAIATFKKLLDETPFGGESQEHWFQAHLSLGRLYEREGRLEDARRLYSSLLERWKNADASLPLLLAVRERAGKLAASPQ